MHRIRWIEKTSCYPRTERPVVTCERHRARCRMEMNRRGEREEAQFDRSGSMRPRSFRSTHFIFSLFAEWGVCAYETAKPSITQFVIVFNMRTLHHLLIATRHNHAPLLIITVYAPRHVTRDRIRQFFVVPKSHSPSA